MIDEYKLVPINKIYLDIENPRHDPVITEAEAIKNLIEHQDVYTLAKHIAGIGGLSPLDIIALIPHPRVKDAFITAEGNRRICSLKLLLDPDKAINEEKKESFRKLKDQISVPITSIRAAVFPNMESARPWMELRHDAPAGIATKRWETADRTRFNRDVGKGDSPNALALELLDYARSKQLLPDDDLSILEKKSITTLTRFLGTPDMRSALGIADNRKLLINVPVHEFEIALTRFLHDALIEKSDINSRANAEARKNYAEKIRASNDAPTTRNLPPVSPQDIPTQKSKSANLTAGNKTPPSSQQRNLRSRDQDRFVIPRGFISKEKDPVFRRLFDELRSIDAETYSFSATYLLRALVEQAALLFIKKHNIQPVPSELHVKLSKVADKLQEQNYKGKGMSALRKMSTDANSRYSPDSIGNFIHGGQVPTRVYVIKAWDSFQPIMEEILTQVTVK